MDRDRYRPGMLFLAVLLIVAVQWFAMNSLQRDFDQKLQQVHEAVNTNSVLNTAMINILAKKNVLDKNEVLQEAQQLSSDIRDMIDKMQAQKKQYQESRKTGDNTTGNPQ